jgi:hypothetical protein
MVILWQSRDFVEDNGQEFRAHKSLLWGTCDYYLLCAVKRKLKRSVSNPQLHSQLWIGHSTPRSTYSSLISRHVWKLFFSTCNNVSGWDSNRNLDVNMIRVTNLGHQSSNISTEVLSESKTPTDISTQMTSKVSLQTYSDIHILTHSSSLTTCSDALL